MDAILNKSVVGNIEEPHPVQMSLEEVLTNAVFEDFVIEDDNTKDEDDYSTWLDYGGDYVPAPNLKSIDKIPSGVYKVIYSRDDYHVVPIKINTDELYRFSEDFTDTILKETDKFWERASIYKKYNLIHKRGILLAGRAGNGKTSVINLLIKQLIERDGLVFFINSIKEFNLYTDIIKTAIRKIEPNRPIITIIEDVDQIISNMGGNDSELLDLLDGKYSINHHLVIFTSNNTTDLSEALLRPSRIDLMYEIPDPNERIRREFFQKKGIPEENLSEYVNATEGMSFAEMKEVFTGTIALGKSLNDVIKQIKHPLEAKDYLIKTKKKIGII